MYEQRKYTLRRAVAERHGLPDLDSVVLIEGPGHAGPTRRMPKWRIAALRAHLEARAAESVVERKGVDGSVGAEAVDAAKPTGALETLCATCKGFCCKTGGEHGYITATTLARVAGDRPGQARQAIVDAYLAHVPARSYAGSCLFHAPGGCALPRDLRSETCRNHTCRAFRAMRALLVDVDGAIVSVSTPAGRRPRIQTHLIETHSTSQDTGKDMPCILSNF